MPTTAVAILAIAASARAAGPDPIGPPSQSLADGCQRNIPGFLTFTSPEWVYVHSYDSQFQAPDQTRVAEGVARDSHPAEDDLPQGHKAFDLNFNLAVDGQYHDLIGGDPAKQTGNYAPGPEQGTLHTEWETEAIPTWAWPTENDRIKIWGSWIWDCGHWGVGFPDYFLPSQVSGSNPNSGPITGERTELHSFKAIVVARANPSAPPATENEADVYASTDGRLAHAQEQCAHDHPAPAGSPTYGPDYTACIQDPAQQRQTVNDRDYSFSVPAPPKPAPNAVLTYRVVDRTGGSQPSETVTVQPNGIDVTVHYTGSSAPAYGKSFFVGWTKPAPKPPTHLLVRVDAIQVNHSLDPNPDRPAEETGTPPGEYNLYLDANGQWQFLNVWAPGLGAVFDGQSFTPRRALDLYVQPGHGVRVLVRGRECDFVGVDPCPDTPELSDQNDVPGIALQSFASVKAALGQHTVASDTSPKPNPLNPNPTPNFTVTYTVLKPG